MSKQPLTSEKLRKHFHGKTFELCNFAIDVAKHLIASGQPAPLEKVLHDVEEIVKELIAKGHTAPFDRSMLKHLDKK